jgi:hypothetical protein
MLKIDRDGPNGKTTQPDPDIMRVARQAPSTTTFRESGEQCFAWVTPKVRWSLRLITQDEGKTEQFQGEHEGAGALPLNAVGCGNGR